MSEKTEDLNADWNKYEAYIHAGGQNPVIRVPDSVGQEVLQHLINMEFEDVDYCVDELSSGGRFDFGPCEPIPKYFELSSGEETEK